MEESPKQETFKTLTLHEEQHTATHKHSTLLSWPPCFPLPSDSGQERQEQGALQAEQWERKQAHLHRNSGELKYFFTVIERVEGGSSPTFSLPSFLPTGTHTTVRKVEG